MSPIKKKVAREAVKSTAKHTAHGSLAKLKRDPMRATTLLALGGLAGGLGGWLLGRATTTSSSSVGTAGGSA